MLSLEHTDVMVTRVKCMHHPKYFHASYW